MTRRELLGVADVSDTTLLSYAATRLGLDAADCALRGSSASVVDYDLDAITTAGRWWVVADVTTPEGDRQVRFFVKHVQSWTRSPYFAFVPPELREAAAQGVPWRTEPLVYTSDLADQLPDGLTMPAVVDVRFVDDLSAVIWLEAVDTVERDWDPAAVTRTAHLLGRLAASPRVRPLAAIGEADGRRGVRSYTEGRLQGQVVPLLRSDELWQHPALVETFEPGLRARLLGHLDRVGDYIDWLEQVPEGAAHGDACPNNLLRRAGDDDLVVIDFGFWSTQPLGFDLGQLLLGDVQLGRRPASQLASLDPLCVEAYASGVAQEGVDIDLPTLRRAHALHMLLFSGFSAFLVDGLLGGMPGPSSATEDTTAQERLQGLVQHLRERAVLTTFVLDLVDATEGIGQPRR
ncbi:MAG: hypothetical protein JWP82_202 [Humibacillus sp.]|nr:hypothetical protein [Humibacillus sp.]